MNNKNDEANLVLLSAGSSEQSTTWRLLMQLGEATRVGLENAGKKVAALQLGCKERWTSWPQRMG